MNELEQRIAIAEFCGWSQFREEVCKTITYLWGFDGSDMDIVPDYLNDLNAMHEAEKKLKVSNEQYSTALMRVIQDRKCVDSCIEARYLTCKATARQRAEALLKTIGKWKD